MKQTTSKMTAIKAVINTWLSDQTFYCNNCGEQFNAEVHVFESCCENPQFGRNIDHCKAVIDDNRAEQKGLFKDTGASEKNTMRFAASLPPALLQTLETYFSRHGEKLFNDNDELHAFMRAFPCFAVARRA